MAKKHVVGPRTGANSFRRYALATTGALAAAGAAGTAEAVEFLYFDVDDVTADAGASIFFNMSTGKADAAFPTPDPFEPGVDPNWTTSVLDGDTSWRVGNYFSGYDEVFINDYPSKAAKKKATKKKAKKSNVAGGSGNPPSTSVANLRAGDLIDTRSFFEIDNHFDANDAGQWQGGGTGFVGLLMHDSNNGLPLFGWAQLTYDDVNNQMTLHDFALSSDPILAGQTAIPEPSSLALLALGAAGLGTLRSRKRSRK